MLHRLILKVTKFQLPPPKRLGTVVKNILGGHHGPPCQINENMRRNVSGGMFCEPVYKISYPEGVFFWYIFFCLFWFSQTSQTSKTYLFGHLLEKRQIPKASEPSASKVGRFRRLRRDFRFCK